MSSSQDHERPKKAAPAALLAAQVRFKPGHAGLKRCAAKRKRDGGPCGQLAAHGMATCFIHHAGTWARLLKSGRPRCAAWRVKRPQGQCTRHVTQPGGLLCTVHATLQEQGHAVALTPKRSRVARVPPRVAPVAPRKGERSPSQAQALVSAAPRELRATLAWRMCTGQRERAALVEAWAQRDTSPGLWRALVRAQHERREGGA